MWNGDIGRLYLIGVYGCAGAAELGAAAEKARSEEEGSTRGTTLRHPCQRNTNQSTHTQTKTLPFTDRLRSDA